MREASVTRVCADLSFFFLLFALFSPAPLPVWLTLSFLAACALCGFFAIRPKKAVFRFLLALPPLL